MNLAEWRAARQSDLTLPSGLIVTVKRVDLQTLLFEGRIPKPLLGMIKELSDGDSDLNFNDAQSIVDNAEQLPELLELFNVTAKASVVNPPLADIADDDHLCVNELSLGDRQAIYEWATTGAQAIAPFPESDPGTANPRQPSAAVSPTTVELAGTTGHVAIVSN